MPIQPASSGPLPPGVRLTGKTPVERSERSASAPPPTDAPVDQVELSAIARGLAEVAGVAEIPIGEVPNERMKEIAARIASRHYDRPEVREQVLRRVLTGL